MSFFEVGFIGQRNRLHRRLQLALLAIAVSFDKTITDFCVTDFIVFY